MIEIPEELSNIFPNQSLYRLEDNSYLDIPKSSGSYLICLNLLGNKNVKIGSSDILVPAGWYFYAGSAKGPGGLYSRVTRHLKGAKKRHWHIDQLTHDGSAKAALCFADRSECDLVRQLLTSNNFATPVKGFGSSDCKNCNSHLLRLMAYS